MKRAKTRARSAALPAGAPLPLVFALAAGILALLTVLSVGHAV